jgi:dTDP-4-dehydrorhamnose 3,5-epimerase
MRFLTTELPGVLIIEPDVYRDARGFFLESYHAQKYLDGGLSLPFVQDNHSFSIRGTVRGLHAQSRRPQGKLLRVIQGEVFDVAVDIRRGSAMFGRWVGIHLSSENFRQCYIPPGFAHGFAVLSESAQLEYKCTDYYDPSDEISVLWDDPEIGIAWPVENPTLSPKDRVAPRLRDLAERLPLYDMDR